MDMQTPALPEGKQPDVVPSGVTPAPSLLLYFVLVAVAVALIGVSFWMRLDWPALLLDLASSLIAAIVLLIFVDRRLRESEVGRIRRLPGEVGHRSLLFVSPTHRQFHSYTRAFLAKLEGVLASKVPLENLGDLSEKVGQNSIVVGEAGTGKTTRLQMLAAHWARSFVNHEAASKTPILFPLRLWKPEEPLEEALLAHVGGFAHVWRWSFERALKKGKAIVIFDGADQLTDQEAAVFGRELGSLRAKYPATRWIVSTRPGRHAGLEGMEAVTLPPLSPEVLERIAERRRMKAAGALS
jgi:predicted NACHT family NTPase